MRSQDILSALDVGKSWTRQIKAEEKRPSARGYRRSMYTTSRKTLREICWEHMPKAWNQASSGGRLPTHWRQVFYVMRPLCDGHPKSDRPLTDATFKNILESYLKEECPGWDVLRGARGSFKEPHSAEADSGLGLSTINVRNYLSGARNKPDSSIRPVPSRFPTIGPRNRIAAVLICEKEGFDELLMAERIPQKYDLALMSTKGISAIAARDLVADLGVPAFTLHDMDKNGFVMAAGFRDATDIGIRMADVEEWGLAPEDQQHQNPRKTRLNLLRNGASAVEADFIASGQRVELNMFTGEQFIEFVSMKLDAHEVRKVIPADDVLTEAWKRAHVAGRVNELISMTWGDIPEGATPDAAILTKEVASMPVDMAEQVRQAFERDPFQSWDEALWEIAAWYEFHAPNED
jgi:hypothetical protein